MAAKKSASKKPAADQSSPTGSNIMESAQQIWLAGLGAFARAQEEGGKLFEVLVREGNKLEAQTRNIATHKADEVRSAVQQTVGQVKARASDSWDRLERVFETRVSKTLESLGVPSAADISTLAERIEELSKTVQALRGDAPATAGAKATKAAKADEPAADNAAPAVKAVKKAVSKVKASVAATVVEPARKAGEAAAKTVAKVKKVAATNKRNVVDEIRAITEEIKRENKG